MKSILLVEDDDRLSQLVTTFLKTEGFDVHRMRDGRNLLSQIKQNKPDVVILDVMLPGEDGFSLCRKLRNSYDGPLLFMTAREDNFDQVLGLEIGADDYIIKPVEPRILLARIHALLRRFERSDDSHGSENTQLTYGTLSINKLSRQVKLGDESIQLTSHEFDMLWKLAENPSQLVDRSTLYTELIGREYDGLDRSADVRISRLRKKLRDNQQNPYRIKTIWGKGFFFVADAWD